MVVPEVVVVNEDAVGARDTRRFLAGDGARLDDDDAPVMTVAEASTCWRMAPPMDLRIAGGCAEL